MDERYTRITVPLSYNEFVALSQSAQCDLRHPRDQARHILRQALGLTETEQESKRDNAGATGNQPHTGIVTVTR